MILKKDPSCHLPFKAARRSSDEMLGPGVRMMCAVKEIQCGSWIPLTSTALTQTRRFLHTQKAADKSFLRSFPHSHCSDLLETPLL